MRGWVKINIIGKLFTTHPPRIKTANRHILLSLILGQYPLHPQHRRLRSLPMICRLQSWRYDPVPDIPSLSVNTRLYLLCCNCFNQLSYDFIRLEYQWLPVCVLLKGINYVQYFSKKWIIDKMLYLHNICLHQRIGQGHLLYS